MDIVGTLLVGLFIAVMAGLVFGVAWLGACVGLGKAVAMSLSCVAWIALMIATYMLLGGKNAFRDGYGLIALLCAAVAGASFLMLRAWGRPKSVSTEGR